MTHEKAKNLERNEEKLESLSTLLWTSECTTSLLLSVLRRQLLFLFGLCSHGFSRRGQVSRSLGAVHSCILWCSKIKRIGSHKKTIASESVCHHLFSNQWALEQQDTGKLWFFILDPKLQEFYCDKVRWSNLGTCWQKTFGNFLVEGSFTVRTQVVSFTDLDLVHH